MASLSSQSKLLATPYSFPYHTKPSRVSLRRVSCKASNDNKDKPNDQEKTFSIDRRNMLIGLGGLYGASNVFPSNQSTLAAPIQPPVLPDSCHPPEDLAEGVNVLCCPPDVKDPIDFQMPSNPSRLRIRPAAHLADPTYIEKYKKALAAMKALPQNDPRSFYQQANIHCAYCNGAYDQVGFPDVNIQVHHSWLFLPFHRWYLYFYERILGSLIDDPTFAIPFWNWDAPKGMHMPHMFIDPNSPLYDAKRNPAHFPDTIVDLDFSSGEAPSHNPRQIGNNLSIMYKQVVRAKKARLFHGRPLQAGSFPDESGDGSLEGTPHGNIHLWSGDPRQSNFENMGNFYSAGRDPLFYAHHANVDRMWYIWKNSLGRKDYKKKDWLNAGFLLFDENAQPVRVYVRDALDERKLGYAYQEVDIPWINSKPKPRKANPWPNRLRSKATTTTKLINKFPLTLDSTVSFEVKRPKKSRSKSEKEDEEEVLVIEKIKHEPQFPLKFDVYINDEDEDPSAADQTEFAGSFVNVPHFHRHGDKKDKRQTTNLSIGISEVLDELDVDGDDSIVVTLVPRVGSGQITIGGAKIEFVRDEED
uniref:(+)-larreatricin hydroxylase, chloroplastic n=1 Tax=Larrea tridentata TaxID=66636 RepID=LAHY_LARTR|nr:RecName: Full=(+)-larreatricin hydroxylase, chloroplastic; AltName: Full=Polyphenol oxidase; Flags: Precursor [Larrea tridentata]AAQ67412.1 (+)-larreatricin hydroxylase [Larrea tridentata]